MSERVLHEQEMIVCQDGLECARNFAYKCTYMTNGPNLTAYRRPHPDQHQAHQAH